jgi:alpha-tubulin suppressor-like RCC1 family protein
LKGDGTVWVCGSNAQGQLGDATLSDKVVPTECVALSDIVAVEAGAGRTFALKSDGSVLGFGSNLNGELGDGTSTDRSTPTSVAGLGNVVKIASGPYHTLFLKGDGTVWACGKNDAGQLGDGTTDGQVTPVQMSGVTDVVAIAAGYSHSVMLKNDGTVWAVGDGANGQMGNGSVFGRLIADQVFGLEGIRSIAAGDDYTLALKSDGSVQVYGLNASGELGDGTTDTRHLPIAPNTSLRMEKIATSRFTVAIKEGGRLIAWGPRGVGELSEVGVYGIVPKQVLGFNLLGPVPAVFPAGPEYIYSTPLGQSINVGVTMSDPSGVVRFYHHDVLLGESTSAPHSINFVPWTWGSFRISAVGEDANGLFSARSTPMWVTVPYDSDNDGLPDWWEIECFEDLDRSFSGDDDNDGLTNAEEFEHDTNPTLADTDGDGVDDAKEIEEGSSPSDPNNSSKLARLYIYTRLE